ncbi:MAG: hypothetical protein E7046_00095 [Lentisphaerae bacterium]|nr:hypothetical protein [Lentisphaerota bacterium]
MNISRRDFLAGVVLVAMALAANAKKDAQGHHPYEKYGARIDYIYVSKGVRVLDFETVNDSRPGEKLYPSDHFPAVATIEL